MSLTNPFVIKKYGAIIFACMITSILFFIGFVFWGMIYGLLFLLAGTLLAVVLANILLKNPFTELLEGKGILAFNLDSTGIIRPFIVQVMSPYVRGNLQGKTITDIFDRATVFQMAKPQKAGIATHKNDGGMDIEMTEEEYNKGRFALFHYPVLIFNQQINGLITKDFLADQEKSVFAEHGVLYLNRKMEELTSVVRDFGRYVVENLKPKQSFLTSKWAMIIVIAFIIILIILFAPAFIDMFKSTSNTIFGASGTITPR